MTVLSPAPLDELPNPEPCLGSLGRLGPLETRLIRNSAELRAAQRLRFDVFSQEFGADLGTKACSGRDEDAHDAVCDHLIVLDTGLPGPDERRIVGTYRLLPADRLGAGGAFYSAATFDIAPLLARHRGRRFVELGRSCVAPAYRGRRTIELLWQGIWAYCRRHDLDVMLGCASFAGTDPAAHAQALSLLHHHARAEGAWAARAHDAIGVDMDMTGAEAIDLRTAMRALPPLVKGYLRLGAKFGDGAVIDPVFASIDVLVILPVEHIDARYLTYYGTDASRFAA
ncbi:MULTISPECIES: GNAT family N-acyltransferase [unclassified Roseitalea]|uniref:GNAT family N-acetyltransferase n=1 Tax=unclassified Roseitalea TaxID=2639107 RepID=UPI00273F0E22|nr:MULTISPECIES: GNAT family N-acyltransferase [unclassified Roseitalea]